MNLIGFCVWFALTAILGVALFLAGWFISLMSGEDPKDYGIFISYILGSLGFGTCLTIILHMKGLF